MSFCHHLMSFYHHLMSFYHHLMSFYHHLSSFDVNITRIVLSHHHLMSSFQEFLFQLSDGRAAVQLTSRGSAVVSEATARDTLPAASDLRPSFFGWKWKWNFFIFKHKNWNTFQTKYGGKTPNIIIIISFKRNITVTFSRCSGELQLVYSLLSWLKLIVHHDKKKNWYLPLLGVLFGVFLMQCLIVIF